MPSKAPTGSLSLLAKGSVASDSWDLPDKA